VTRTSPGATPRTLAVIGDMPHHRDEHGTLHGLEPVVAQLDCWADLFDELVLGGPLLPGPPPAGFAPYRSPNVRLHELPRGGGNTLRAKLGMIPLVPVWAWRTRQLARSVDAVHLRSPCNIAMVATLSTWKAVRYRYALYAGVWRGYEGEPRFFRYQRELLGSNWFDGPVSVYAGPDPRHPHLEPFFSPSYDLATWERSTDVADAARQRVRDMPDAGPWRAIVVGRLTPNKNHKAAIEALRLLVAQGVDISMDLAGDGPEREHLTKQVAAAGLTDRVRFHGMVDYGEVMRLFGESDVQILSTYQEGFGKVLLEGMVQGVVPVLSHSPVADEIAGHGSRGVVVDPDDAAAMAAAVQALIADRERWEAMVNDARAFTRELTLESFAVRVRQLLERQWGVTFEEPADP